MALADEVTESRNQMHRTGDAVGWAILREVPTVELDDLRHEHALAIESYQCVSREFMTQE